MNLPPSRQAAKKCEKRNTSFDKSNSFSENKSYLALDPSGAVRRVWRLGGEKLFLSVLICFCLSGFASAKTAPTPANSTDVDVVGQKLDEMKEDIQKLKESWDKTRLEVTLYEKRAKRAYQKWVKAAKSVKAAAKNQKEKADLELQLAVEKRKLAFSQWQSKVFLQTAEESHLKSLAQDRDSKAIQEKIGQLEAKLKPLSTPAASVK